MDDLDDLLNEVEKDLEAKTKTSEKRSKSIPLSNLDDDVNDILDDDDLLQSCVVKKADTSHQSKTPTTKCGVVYLGGSSSSSGLCSRSTKKTCNRLRCTGCDFKVEQFDDFEWSTSVDYLFLRNNMPEFDKIAKKLVPKSGSRAYACQCSWKSLKSLTNLQSFNLKWVCGKH